LLQSLGHNLAGSGQDVTFSYGRNQTQEIKTLSWSNDLYGWTATQGTRAFTPNGLNQYTAVASVPYSYDGNGNLTGDGVWSYGYDADNRLRTATASNVTATLAWDAVGRLRQTTTSGTATRLLYAGNQLVAEYDGAGALLRRYVHGPGSDEPVVKYEGTGTANKSWYYADHLGSIVAAADGAGNATSTLAYGPYGESGPTLPARFGYTGQQYIAPLGLYHYKARFYSPTIGRFLQTDPIGYGGGMNLYAYVDGNPINLSDPEGERGWTGAVLGAINGGLSGALALHSAHRQSHLERISPGGESGVKRARGRPTPGRPTGRGSGVADRSGWRRTVGRCGRPASGDGAGRG
jgi:RHS repeat-associated protein